MTYHKALDHMWIALTVALATYSQLVLRWQMSMLGEMPAEPVQKLLFIASTALKPWILSALFATFLSGLSWMVVLNKFELSYAFPFTALNFMVILGAGVVLLGESLTTGKVIGTCIVITGVIVMAVSTGNNS